MGLYGTTWEAGGYAGDGPVAELIGTLQGRPSIVCGNATGVFDELVRALAVYPDAVIYGVNDVGMYLPRMDHWVSLHSDNLGVWKSVRWLHTRDREQTLYHAVDARAFVDYNWSSIRPIFALSGYFAMQIAHVMGSGRIILCGCPGSSVRRFFEAAPRVDFAYGNGNAGGDAGVRQQLEKEMERIPDFRIKVRSMSGWTREYFGGI
jgi:hypothetical protein